MRGGLASIKFNSLTQEKTGHAGDSGAETELNKHTFVTPGINFVARCENKACRIQNEIQYLKKGIGSFHVNEIIYE